MQGRYIPPVRLILIALLTGITIFVPAGGTAETSGDRDAASEISDHSAERRSRQKDLLSSIGISVFNEEIDSVDFTLAQLTGDEISLQKHRGQLVFLNFWATWCPPCREEMPAMEAMQTALADLPFTILAVSVQEERNTVQRYIDEFGFTFPILLDPSGRVASHYGVRGLPTTFFIGPEGSVLGMLIGIRDWHDPEILSTLRDVAELNRM